MNLDNNEINNITAPIENDTNNSFDNPFNTLKPMELPKPHKFLEAFTDNFPFFLKASLLYALIYAICRFENKSGFTTPFLAIASVFFFKKMLDKIGIAIKKTSYIYPAIAVALGINCFLSDDAFIITVNFWVALVLFITFLLQNTYDCSDWSMGIHVSALLESTLGLVGHMFMQPSDKSTYNSKRGVDTKEKKSSGTKFSIFVGVCVSLVMLTVILPLLSSADKFFAEAVDDVLDGLFDIFENLDSFETAIRFVLYTVFLFLIVYGLIRKMCCHNIKTDVRENSKYSATTAITVNSILGFVYVVFSGFQIFYLFLGNMTLPEHATYAEYAHEGFFQLVAVCIINMLMVLFIIHCFENTMALRISLTVISACTFIMIASSTLRMIMYVQAYDLSYLRYFVFWALIVIFMLMIGIVIYTFKKDFPMFRYGMTVLAVLYLGYAYSNPTYNITKYNIEKAYIHDSEGSIKDNADLYYLCHDLYNANSAKAICDLAIKYNDTDLFEYFYKDPTTITPDYTSDFRKFNLAKLEEAYTVRKCYYTLHKYTFK